MPKKFSNVLFFCLLILVPNVIFAAHSKQTWLAHFENIMMDINKTPNIIDLQIEAMETLLISAEHEKPKAIDILDENNDWIVEIIKKKETRGKAKSSLLKLVSAENSFAMFFVYLRYGKSFTLDQIEKLFDNPFYNHHIGEQLLKEGKIDEALLRFSQAANKGFSRSLRKKVEIFGHFGSRPNVKERVSILRILAKRGDETSMVNLALDLELHNDLAEFKDESIYWLRSVSKKGDMRAMCQLATFILAREKPDFVEARDWIDLADQLNKKNPNEEVSKLINEATEALNTRERADKMGHSFTSKGVVLSDGTDLENAKANSIMSKYYEGLNRFLDAIEKFRRENNIDMSSEENEEGQSDEDDEHPEVQLSENLPDVRAEKTDEKDEVLKKIEPFITTEAKQETIKQKVVANNNIRDQKQGPSLKPSKTSSYKASHTPTSTSAEHSSKSPLFTELAKKLDRVKNIVYSLLDEKTVISSKDMRKLLNRLKVSGPTNVSGSHQNMNIALSETHQVSKTLIKPHKNSSPHTNSKKLRDIFNQFGINSGNQLWKT